MMGRMYATIPDRVGGTVVSAEPLRHNAGNAATGGSWRVRGPAGSAVLKLARPPAAGTGIAAWRTSDDPAHYNYWQREALAYAGGLTRAYADAGITAPDLLATARRDDGQVEVWLSDVPGPDATSWSPDRFGEFARRLGMAQAGYVDRLPDVPYLSRGWLGQYLRHGPAVMTVLPAAGWDHPVARVWPEPVRERLAALWRDPGAALARALTAPRTLCHLDVWPTNMIGADAVGSGGADAPDATAAMTLLDWAFVGEGGLGEDPANLIVDAVTGGLIPMAALPDIRDAVTDGYLAGLAEGGWHGDPAVVVEAIGAYAVAKYSWFAPLRLAQAIDGADVTRSFYGQDTSATEALTRVLPLVTRLAAWAA